MGRFAVASSLGVYAGRTEIAWHEELALPAAELPNLIVAFKKALEPLTTHGLQGSGVHLLGAPGLETWHNTPWGAVFVVSEQTRRESRFVRADEVTPIGGARRSHERPVYAGLSA